MVAIAPPQTAQPTYDKLASRAVLWYNKHRNSGAQAVLDIPLSRTNLDWRFVMDMIPQDSMPRKQCSGPCGRWLPATLDYFYPTAKTRTPGLRPKCRECAQAQRREYLARPDVKQHKHEQSKEYLARPEVQEHRQEYRKEYYARPDARQHRQEYYERPDIVQHGKDQKKEYHARPDVKERIEDYLSRPDIQQSRQAWREEYRTHPETKERDRIHSNKRRARKQSAGGTYTLEQIQGQLKRQKYRCYYAACGHARFKKQHGKYVYHVEHTFPLSRATGDDPINDISYLVLACPSCNQSKHDKYPWEWPEGGRLL